MGQQPSGEPGRPGEDEHDNLRDVASVAPSLKPGLVFRSSSMHSLDIRQKLNIQAVLDLRKSSRPCRQQSGIVREMIRPDWLLVRLRSAGMHAARSAAVQSCPNCEHQLNSKAMNGETKVFHVDMCTLGFKLNVFASLPGYAQLQAAGRALTLRSPKPPVEAVVADEDEFAGGHMYRLFLDHSKAQIAKLFFVLTHRENYPLLIHCIHGKDRTGIAVMLLLSVCGVEEERIVEDYMKSKQAMASWQEHGEAPVPQDDVPAVYRRDIKQAIEHVQRQYGGVTEYLESCGVTSEQQQCVRGILCRDGAHGGGRAQQQRPCTYA